MNDGTSSEGSHSYASDAPYWEFGDDSYVNDTEEYRYLGQTSGEVITSLHEESSNEDPRVGDGDAALRDEQPLIQEPTVEDRVGSGGFTALLLLPLRTDSVVDGAGSAYEGADEVDGEHRADNGAAGVEDEVRHVGSNQDANIGGDTEASGAIGRVDDRESQHPTVINLDGFHYTRSRQSTHRISYRRSIYRRTGCRGKVQYNFELASYINFVPHSCRARVVAPTSVTDVVTLMQDETDRLATTNQALTAQQIWDQVRLTFFNRNDGVVVRGLTRMQVMSRVHRTRRIHFGGNVHGVIEVPPLSLVAGVDLQFFQFHHASYDDGQLQRIIGWAHPRLLELLRYPGTHLFVDGTFRSVPRSFHQCVVVMVRDAASRVFVPVVYALTTNRTTSTYNKMFRFIADAVGQTLQPAQVVADFEQALIDAVGDQFPSARVIGCLFHWKQAIRRRMIKLHLPSTEVGIAMEVGMLDMLTVIPPVDVDPAGLRFVERSIRRRCREEHIPYSARQWTEFWAYFRRTWLTLFPVNVWNVHGMDLQVVSRTNNPLERFNRELNAAVTTPHPSLAAFVGTIDGLSQRYVRLLQDITNRRAVAPQQGVLQLPEPVAFTRQGVEIRRPTRGRQRTRTGQSNTVRNARTTQRRRRSTRSSPAV